MEMTGYQSNIHSTQRKSSVVVSENESMRQTDVRSLSVVSPTHSAERNVGNMLAKSNAVISLKYDHLNDAHKPQAIIGTKRATELGITTMSENFLQRGKSNGKSRLNKREQEYVLSQIIQHNFDKRRGLSVFQSKSARTSFVRRA
jgi:hypothetical protein